ncbi:hypothetical protein, partial [Mycobacterium sp. P7213]|uniref:hypothetical protein n=1 Tax=Mycobacterium sp. P7213 TaxID=2478465 RepID=UPI0013DD9716
ALVTAIGIAFLAATSRDENSYQAGRSYGARVLSGHGLNASSIEMRCKVGAALARDRDGYYFWPGGQIKGSDVDKDDFTQGCIETTR